MTNQQLLTAFITIVRKEITRFMRIWQQTLIPPVITTSLYFIIFGNLIGPRIGQMQGYSYIDFIVPGLILMAVITNSYGNVASSFYSAKFSKSVEELQVSPTPNWVILLGYVCGGVLRGILVGLFVTLIAMYFSGLSLHNVFIIISVVILTAVLFSMAGFLNALFAKSFDDISIIPTFVLTPMTYLGGVFYSITLLPEFWQKISFLNPILYMINTFRLGFLGITDINPWLSYGLILGFIAVLSYVNLRLLKTGFGLRS